MINRLSNNQSHEAAFPKTQEHMIKKNSKNAEQGSINAYNNTANLLPNYAKQNVRKSKIKLSLADTSRLNATLTTAPYKAIGPKINSIHKDYPQTQTSRSYHNKYAQAQTSRSYHNRFDLFSNQKYQENTECSTRFINQAKTIRMSSASCENQYHNSFVQKRVTNRQNNEDHNNKFRPKSINTSYCKKEKFDKEKKEKFDKERRKYISKSRQNSRENPYNPISLRSNEIN